MKIVVSGTELKAIEEYAINTIKLPSLVLMERAAFSVFEYLKAIDEKTKVLVLAGVGNNGADAVAVARMLAIAGKQVELKIVGDISKATDEFKVQYEIYKNVAGIIIDGVIDYRKYEIAVDGLFGIGLKRDITGEFKEIIENTNNEFESKTIVAIDMPSGIDADTGKVLGAAIKAHKTITFSCYKKGLLLPPGNVYAGDVNVIDIGIPKEAFDNKYTTFTMKNRNELKLVDRDINGNKGTFGKVLVIAGSDNMTGAAYLCGKAAYRMGSGLVRIATKKECRELIQKMLPEAVIAAYNDDCEELKESIAWADSIVIGPGIGKEKCAYDVLKLIMQTGKNIVIDADGLNIISEHQELKVYFGKNVIITPHIGEMSRLCKKSIEEIKENVLEVATDFAKEYDITVVLKDARTVVASSLNELRYINITGNDGMATAGSGDVLAGMMASLYANDNNAFNVAINAVYLHGMAGNIVAEKLGCAGVMASDIANMAYETLK